MATAAKTESLVGEPSLQLDREAGIVRWKPGVLEIGRLDAKPEEKTKGN
jgi:hypothetical protein